MVNVKCVHCGQKVHEFEVSCPNCGKPVANKDAPTNVAKSPTALRSTGQKKNTAPMIIGGLILLAIIGGIVVMFVL